MLMIPNHYYALKMNNNTAQSDITIAVNRLAKTTRL